MKNILFATAAVLGLALTVPAIAAQAEGQRVADADSNVGYAAPVQTHQVASSEQATHSRLPLIHLAAAEDFSSDRTQSQVGYGG